MNMPAPTASVSEELDCPEDIVHAPGSPCFGKPAGRPRAADKEARLQALLQTAAWLFLEKGYNKVSLEMIAREAHVAVRTIYVKFGGKAGLLNAIIYKGRARFFEGMDNMETDTRPLEDILGDFSVRFLELVSTPSFAGLHRMVIAESMTTPELAETFYRAGPLLTREQLMRLFSRPEIRAQLRPEVPVDMLAIHLINCLLGDHVSRMLFPQEYTPSNEQLREQAKQGLDLFLRGVLR